MSSGGLSSAVAVLIAETTDTPVWWLVAATAALVVVTGLLVVAGFRALGDLTMAIEALEESRKDRHVAVFQEFGRRWEGPEMTEALILLDNYTPEGLLELFKEQSIGPTTDTEVLRRRRERVVLIRIPSYFEDAGMIAAAGSLNDSRFRENFGGIAAESWAIWEPTVRYFQEGDPQSFCEFARLATEIEQEDKSRGVDPPPSD